MMKFLNQKVQDTTWGQYIMAIIVVYAAFFGWLYKDAIVEKLEETKEKFPRKKYVNIEEENFDE